MKKFLLFLTFTLSPLVAYSSMCPGGHCPPSFHGFSSVISAGSLSPHGSDSPSLSDFRTQPAAPHPAVVRIVVENAKSQNYGTGTWIRLSSNRCAVLTCAHLFDTETPKKITVYFPNQTAFNVQIQAIDRTWDVALLQTSAGDAFSPAVANHFPTPVALSKEPPRQGDFLRMCGYGPHGRSVWVLGKTRGYCHLASVSETHTLVVSGIARQGDSGAPLLTLDGRLVGVLWGTDGKSIYGTWSGKILKIFPLAFRESVPNIEENPSINNSVADIDAEKPFATIRNRILTHQPPRPARLPHLKKRDNAQTDSVFTEANRSVIAKTDPKTTEIIKSENARKRLFQPFSDCPVRAENVVKKGILHMFAPQICALAVFFLLAWFATIIVTFVILRKRGQS